ncbi:thymine dioxygenase [Mycena olivaceomarginata]|nr:thymine dioxygenase [Mycena olivaceomarginata]
MVQSKLRPLWNRDDNFGIAIVDFGAFLDGSDNQAVTNEMLASFKKIGFRVVYLLNHGIPPEWIAWRVLCTAHGGEMLAPHPPSGTHHRGQEKVIQHVYGSDAIAEQCAQAPMSRGLLALFPGFKETCVEYFWVHHQFCYKIELRILRALALGLQLPEDVPTEALETEKIAWIGQHSDFGSITLLFQDDVGGLEVEDPHFGGSFGPAPPVPAALVVNAGHFMIRCTLRPLILNRKKKSNNTIRSTVHRVKSTNGMTPERHSIPYVRRTHRLHPGT